jgi:NAD(P)-dependent dehydrogenase (short-subunit alcohol dehydrogenase family)
MASAVTAFDEAKNAAVPASLVPLKRTGNQDDMGGLILYLASRAGAYVNGNVTVVDGGRLSFFCSTY